MTLLVSICVAILFAVSVYLILGRELKEVAMGLFLLSHAAHLGILAMSGQPLFRAASGELISAGAPVLGSAEQYVDPLPQALILTSIVISFAVMAFILTLLVVTHRRAGVLDVNELAREGRPETSDEL